MKSTTFLHIAIKALVSWVFTVWWVALFLYILIFVFYSLDPTCESFIGEYEQWACSFSEYVQGTVTMIILVTWIPFLSICLYPFTWVAISTMQSYQVSHKKTIFTEMWKKFLRLGFSFVVSLIVSFVIISFYNSYLIDTLHLIEGWIFSTLIFLIWPLSYYGIYRLITKKVTKIK